MRLPARRARPHGRGRDAERRDPTLSKKAAGEPSAPPLRSLKFAPEAAGFEWPVVVRPCRPRPRRGRAPHQSRARRTQSNTVIQRAGLPRPLVAGLTRTERAPRSCAKSPRPRSSAGFNPALVMMQDSATGAATRRTRPTGTTRLQLWLNKPTPSTGIHRREWSAFITSSEYRTVRRQLVGPPGE